MTSLAGAALSQALDDMLIMCEGLNGAESVSPADMALEAAKDLGVV